MLIILTSLKQQPFIAVSYDLVRQKNLEVENAPLLSPEPTVVVRNLWALATQLSRNGLEEIWSPYLIVTKKVIYHSHALPL